MSVQAMAWALDHRQTGPLAAEFRLVLVALADYADPTGRNAFPSAYTLHERLGVTVRSVRRAFALLEDLGLIRRGDQARAAHYRADRRPVVWDLALDGIQVVVRLTGAEVDLGAEPYDPDIHGVSHTSPREPVDNYPRGDSHGRHGVTATSPKPTTNPNLSTPLSSEGDPKARVRASASRPVPPDPGPPVRALGMTRPDCPACGAVVHRTHRCKASALDPSSPVNASTVRELLLATPEPPPVHPTLELHLGLSCAWCGRNAPTNDAGVCLRCAMNVAKVGPHPHPLEVERP